MKKKTVDITEEQEEWLQENHINFSSLVREELRKIMKEQKFNEERKQALQE
jgi:Arc/MetJ-type ribon-helix-helix transcriptional regulator